ncbi:MAG: DsbA family protein [Synechococcales bacterium]|nr:DsbA family protein [Synechococcales bacterium]
MNWLLRWTLRSIFQRVCYSLQRCRSGRGFELLLSENWAGDQAGVWMIAALTMVSFWVAHPAIATPLQTDIHRPMLASQIEAQFSSGNLVIAQAQSSPIDPKLEAQVLEILRRNPEVILESVQRYQQKKAQEAQKAQQAVLKRLKQNSQAAIAQSPQLGNGQVILFEFSDFQCPFCAEVGITLKQFVQKNRDRVTLVYKHFPLATIHPEAVNAVRAAWAAHQQGRFWQYHDALFEQQKQLSDATYRQIATDLKLDLTRWQRDRTSPAAAQALTQDLQLGEQLGIDGTPFFVMDGKAFSGAVPLAELEARLAQAGS